MDQGIQMGLGILPKAEFVHLALLVSDIERAMDTYCALLGVERPLLKQSGDPQMAKVIYNGEPTPARIWQTFFTLGGARLELMQPDEHPSTWREYLDRYGDCVHHAGYAVASLEDCVRILAGHGMPLVQTGNFNGGKYAYVDGRAKLGMMLELLEMF